MPFTIDESTEFNYKQGDMLFVEGIKQGIANGQEEFIGKIISGDKVSEIKLYVKNLTPNEKKILLEGCLINFYASNNK
jgi:aconitate hydratase